MRKLIAVLFILIACPMFIGGCGSSTSNDQGVAFTFIGWFEPGEDDPEQITTGLYSLGDAGTGNTGNYLLAAGLQNNLFGQAIRVQRIHYDYEVIGGEIEIPSTSVVLNSFLGPIQDNSSGSFEQGSTLPDSLSGDSDNFESTVFAGVPVLPASITNFISLNRNSFPQRPFSIIVRAYASGVTTAGREIASNDFEFEIVVVNDVDIIESSGAGGLSTQDNISSNSADSDSDSALDFDDSDSEVSASNDEDII